MALDPFRARSKQPIASWVSNASSRTWLCGSSRSSLTSWMRASVTACARSQKSCGSIEPFYGEGFGGHEHRALGLRDWLSRIVPSGIGGARVGSVHWSKLEAGEVASFTRLDELTDQADRDVLLKLGLRSATVVPVAATTGAGRSALFFGSTAERACPPVLVEQLRLVSAVIGQALSRMANLMALQRALDDLQRLQESVTEENETGADARVLRESRNRAGLDPENMCRRREILESPDPRIIGRSSAIRRVLAQLQQVAATDSTVLLLGETGTGKELLATHLHGLSARRVRANGARQLRGDSRDPYGKRAVRPRKGRVHGRSCTRDRAIRIGPPLYDFP